MLFIFGFRTKAYILGRVAALCHVCGQTGNQLLVREVTKISLFFGPLIPVRTKYLLECRNLACRTRTRIDRSEAERLMRSGVSPA